jgi:F-type H+-transporting ATPase subunit delta
LSAVAERYAAALASVGLERKRDVKGDLSAFLEVFYSSAELRNALETPAVSEEIKERVIREVTEKMGIDETVRNFIYLVVAHRRTEMFREMLEALGQQLNMRMGIAEA